MIVNPKSISILKSKIDDVFHIAAPKTSGVGIDDLFISAKPILKPVPEDDVFKKSLEKISSSPIPIANLDEYRSCTSNALENHKKRLAKYSQNITRTAPRSVTKDEFNAMKLIQYEMDAYTEVQKKLRNGGTLTKAEEQFCKNVLKGMRKTDKDITLWRSILPYAGFDDAVNSGKLNMLGFTSTCRDYNDFFDFWGGPKLISVNKKPHVQQPYFLKINVPKGTSILDCNATYKGKVTRMTDEVILLPSQCDVINVDNSLNVIELLLNQS